ncbi:MAG: hypothetical protein JNK38_02355 [Acidobacteria bacterium]|nr:hypothetical protein [Acidobacteriota bacterium]
MRRLFSSSQVGYDTHADQINAPPTLHRTLAESLKAFYDDWVANNLADKTLILSSASDAQQILKWLIRQSGILAAMTGYADVPACFGKDF